MLFIVLVIVVGLILMYVLPPEDEDTLPEDEKESEL
jgi:hypothetical protein